MTISGISNNVIYQPISGTDVSSQKKSDFQQLVTAVQSGNLQQAQQAFTAISQNAPANSSSQTSQASSDFQAIGKALQSGDVSGAQKALSNLQQDLKAGGSHG